MNRYFISALLAALLFGLSTPLSKMLLAGINPVLLAGIYYAGSALVFAVFSWKGLTAELRPVFTGGKDSARIALSTLFGGVLAPICLLYGLKLSEASTSALLLNLETAATSIIAWSFFREHVTKQAFMSVVFAIAAGVILSFGGGFSVSFGAALIVLACFAWGLDNNFSSVIESVTPRAATFIKCISAGLFNIVIGMLLPGAAVPSMKIAIPAVMIGFLSYGLSIQLYVYAARNMGAARSQVIFASNPFIGVLVSVILLSERPDAKFYAALALAAASVAVLYWERHAHLHVHEPVMHDHEHTHDDGHHSHTHPFGDRRHSHSHVHAGQTHEHAHYPDIHHRHLH